ncbi:MAG: hypothetical protein PHZ23_14845 [Acidiphilium sp.]|nr:hypothetical protein [Acidiphilium sp.]
MEYGNFNNEQFVDSGTLNNASALVSGAIAITNNMMTSPGIINPDMAMLSFSGLTVTADLPAPFGVLFGDSHIAQAHGTQTNADTQSYAVSFSSLVPASGSVTAYLLASAQTIYQNPTTIVGPPPGHPNYNPNFVPYTGYLNTVDSLALSSSTTAADNSTTFEIGRTTLTAGQTSITSMSTQYVFPAAPMIGFKFMARTAAYSMMPMDCQMVQTLAASGITLALPPAEQSVGLTAQFLASFTSGTALVVTSGSDVIWGAASGSVTSLTMSPGASFTALSEGGSWRITNANAIFTLQNGAIATVVPNATVAQNPLPLGQAQADFAAINGSASEAFNVDTATAAANAVPLAQLESLINNRTTPYDLFAGFAGVGTDSQIIGNTNIVRSIQFPRNLVWSTAYALTAATDATTYLIYHNSTQVGTLTFAASATLGVFSCSGFSAVAGDTVSIHGPATADTTLASVTVTILGSTISANSPYDLQFGCGTKPASSQIIGTFVLSETITISSAFAGSICTALTAATSTAVLRITANGSSIGSITFSSGGTDGVFSGAGGTFDAGAVIQVFAPSVQDSTLAGVSGTVFSESTTLQNVYPFMAGLSGAPSAGEAIAAFDFVRPVYFPANMVSSEAIAGVAPTNAVTCTVTLGGTTVATADFAAGATTGTFATSAAFTATPTQTMKIIAPSSTDSTFADPSFTLWGVTI